MDNPSYKRAAKGFLWAIPVLAGMAIGAYASLVPFKNTGTTGYPAKSSNGSVEPSQYSPETSKVILLKNDSLQSCGKGGMNKAAVLVPLPRQPHD